MKNSLCLNLFAPTVMIVMFAAGCGSQPPTRGVELQLVDIAGVQKLIESHRGQVVVLDAWSTSCEPCMREFPHLVALGGKYPSRVACLSLSIDYEGLGKPEDQRPKVMAFLEQQHATITNLLSTEDSEATLKHLQVGSIPAVFVYDQSGKLAERFDRAGFTYREVEARVEALLKP